MVDDVPEEYEYLFGECTEEELIDVRDELLACMN